MAPEVAAFAAATTVSAPGLRVESVCSMCPPASTGAWQAASDPCTSTPPVSAQVVSCVPDTDTP